MGIWQASRAVQDPGEVVRLERSIAARSPRVA